MRIAHYSASLERKFFIPLLVSPWVHWSVRASSFSWWKVCSSRCRPMIKKTSDSIQLEGYKSQPPYHAISQYWNRRAQGSLLSPTACASSCLAVASSLSRSAFRSVHGRRQAALLTSTRFASSVSSLSLSSSSLPSFFHTHCILCDAPFDNWVAHTELPSHAARVALSEAFVKPERSASMLSQLKENICVDFSLIEEATQVKVQRRKRRLRSSLQYLVQQGVLHHCLPTVSLSPTTTTASVVPDTTKGDSETRGGSPPLLSASPSRSWEISNSDTFLNSALVGQAYIREALTDRVARLAPRSKGTEVSYIVHYLSTMRQWSKLFDLLELSTVLCPLPYRCTSSSFSLAAAKMTAVTTPSTTPAKESAEVSRPPSSVRLTQAEKAMLLWSCVGELRVTEEIDRSHKVENTAVTEQLVHHVLVSHCLDNLLSELLHHGMEKVVEECTPVWRWYQKQEALMRLRAYQSRPPALSPVPVKKKESPPSSTPAERPATAPHMALVEDANGKPFLPLPAGCAASSREAQLLALFLSPWIEYTGGAPGEPEGDRLSASLSAAEMVEEKALPTKGLPEKKLWGTAPLQTEKKYSATTRFGGENSTSSSSSSSNGVPRGLWQDVYRQLLYERPIVPVETPAASFAPFYPRLQPSSSK